MASIFSKIIDGTIPAYKVAENEDFIAFLDISPVAKGHTLVVPKREIDYFFDIDDELLQAMMLFSKKVAKGLESVVPCNRIGVAVIGLEVPHAHMHLIPIYHLSDMDFAKPRVKLSAEEMSALAVAIQAAIVW